MKLRNGWGAQQWHIILLRAGKAGEGLEETGVDREVHVTAGREAGATVKMAGVTVNEIGETVKEDDAAVLCFEGWFFVWKFTKALFPGIRAGPSRLELR